MSLILDGTNGETFPSWTTAGRPASPSAGQTGYNTTLNSLEAYNGSSWVIGGLPAPSTSGNLLTSDGTNWTSAAAPASGGMTLLGTITPTAVNSASLSSLTLTSYKSLYIVFNAIVLFGNSSLFISSTNVQTGGGYTVGPSNISPSSAYGTAWLDLTTGVIGGALGLATPGASGFLSITGLTNVTTSSTIIYFRQSGTNNFTASSITIYGVK